MENLCTCGNTLCTSRIDLFKNLPIEVQQKIVSTSNHFETSKNETIVFTGDRADFIIVVRAGKLKCVHYDIDGKEHILDILVKGDTVGEEFFMQKERFEYDIVAITNVQLCRISKIQLLDVLRENMDWAIVYIDLLSQKLRIANEKIKMLMEDNGLRRVAAFLIERDERLKGEIITLTVDEIAASTNLRRETVSRKINEMQKRNLIERLGQKQIKILDKEEIINLFYEY